MTGLAVGLGGLVIEANAARPTTAPSPAVTPPATDPCQGLTGPQLVLCRAGQVPGNVVGGAVQFGADQAVVAQKGSVVRTLVLIMLLELAKSLC